MYQEVYATKCKKDIKKLKRQGKDRKKLKDVVNKIVQGEPLEEKYKEHYLSNNWAGCLECHIEPDWLLIYCIDPIKNTVYFLRSGSHSELFEAFSNNTSLKQLNEELFKMIN